MLVKDKIFGYGEAVEKAIECLKDRPEYIPPTILAVGALGAVAYGQAELAVGLGVLSYATLPKNKEAWNIRYKGFIYEHSVG